MTHPRTSRAFSISITCLFWLILAMVLPMAAALAGENDWARLREQSAQAEDRGDVALAIRLSLKLLELKPNDLPTMVSLSGLYGKAGHPQQQLAWTQRILKLQPNNFDALINRGNAMVVLGNAKGARDHFTQAKSLEPANPVAAYSLGVLAQLQERHAEAAGHFKEALRLSPDFEDALFNLAVSHANLGQYSMALMLLDRLLTQNPSAADAKALRTDISRRAHAGRN